MNAVIFGATGMVGSEVLSRCLASDRFDKVLTIGRKKTGVDHAKLNEIQHENFLEFSSLQEDLSRVDVCFYCLGVYQSQVSAEKFWQITVDYLQALLITLEDANKDIVLCLFSAQGADQTERSPIRFARAKGRAEKLLSESGIHQSYIFRPGYIRPGAVAAQAGWSGWLAEQAYRVFPQIGIDAPDLAKVMIDISLNGHNSPILSNRDLRRKISFQTGK
jgi:uncharacterized protein YbjT (DUF2867 family)